jgi:WD40 repeat protein
MRTKFVSAWLRLGGGVILVGLGAALCADAQADQAVEADLKRLTERLAEPSVDPARLCEAILEFRLQHPGTTEAARAAVLLSRLRSPLDNLQAANIAPLERFDAWQPKELVAVIGEHRGRHAAPVSCLAYSSDGLLIASGGGNYVRLWDPATLRLHALVGHGAVTCLAFSRDHKALVVGGAGGTVTVWDVSKDKQLKLRLSVQASTSPVYGVAFAPDGKSIAAVCYDNALRLYDVSGKNVEELAVLGDHTQAVSAVAYSPDGKTLATGSYDKTIRLWDVRGKLSNARSVLEGQGDTVTALAYSSKGVLASAGANGTVLLWGGPSGAKPKPRLAFTPNAGSVAALCFSPSGSTLALACADGTARLWSVAAAPRERAKLEGHAAAVNGVAFSADGKTLATGSSDWTVRSWDVSSTRPKERFMPWSHLSVAYGIDFSLDLSTLVSGSEDRVIRLWDLTKPELRTRAYLKSDDKVPIYSVAYSPDGKTVAAGGLCTNVRQWDARTPVRTRPTLRTPSYVHQLHYSPDSRFLLTRSLKTVILWDAHSSGEVRRFPTEDMDIHCLAWSPDGQAILTGHGVPLQKDGKYVYQNGVHVYTDCMLRMFEAANGKQMFRDKSFTVPIFSAGFSVDGRQAFTGLYEPALRRWEVTAGALKKADGWKGSSGYVQLMRFAPDGEHVVTSGLDGQLVLWDLATGKRIRQWSLPELVSNVAYALDSRHVAVSLMTGVILVLRLTPVADSP